MMDSTVWITGTGVCTPVGQHLTDLGKAVFCARSGIDKIRQFDVAQHPSQMAASIDRVQRPAKTCESEFYQLPRVQQAALWCCAQALQSGGIDPSKNPRIGLILGLGSEWLFHWEECGTTVPETSRATTASVARHLELTGPAITISAACASGNHALSMARNWLRLGLVDHCLAGACDMGITPMTLAGFGNLRALSRRNDDPLAACRPFDRDRDGFVLGEGGAVFLLERAADARRRGVEALAEVAGCGATSDAYQIVAPCPDTTLAESAISGALADARIGADEIDYVNAHGTATPLGDVGEARTLKNALGLVMASIPVSSTKSVTGHALTGAAAIEAAIAIEVLRCGIIPPTLNLRRPDPECDLFHVTGSAIERSVRTVLSNSFGFGGSNTALILRNAA